MADRDPSFFGAVLPQPEGASEAFTAEQLVQIRARRIAADFARCEPSAWPAKRRFETMFPRRPDPYVVYAERVASRTRVNVS